MVVMAMSHLVNREWSFELQISQCGEFWEKRTTFGVRGVELIGLGGGGGGGGGGEGSPWLQITLPRKQTMM